MQKSLPVEVEKFLVFVENQKFVVQKKYLDYETACYVADPDYGFFGGGKVKYKTGYHFKEPFFLATFKLLIKFFWEKQMQNRAKFVLNIFDKYIGINHIHSPEIIYIKKGKAKDYWRNDFEFCYGEPKKVEGFDVCELVDNRPEFIKKFFDEMESVVCQFLKVDELENQINNLKMQVEEKKVSATTNMELLENKFEAVLGEDCTEAL